MKRFLFLLLSLCTSAALAFPAAAFTTPSGVVVNSGDLIKSPAASAVYYFAEDGKRYVFPNEKTYFTWYSSFSNVKTISTGDLAAIQIGGNVTYRPGTRMIKIQSDPKVYTVAPGGILRPIASESVAAGLYGSTWNRQIDDLSDAFFINYKVGSSVNAASNFDMMTMMGASPSINTDKMLVAPPAGYVNVNQNTNFANNATMTLSPSGKITWIATDSSMPSVKLTPPANVTATSNMQSSTLGMGEAYTYVFPQTGAWAYSNANVSGGASGHVTSQ